jgi:hypothetical protein
MMSFSSDQLATLQKALARPMPDLEPPPSMSRVPLPATPKPQPQPQQQQQQQAQAVFVHVQPKSAAQDPSAAAQSAKTLKSIPLSPLAAAYLGVAVTSALVSLARPDRTLDAALLASPLLSVALATHALALPAELIPQKILAAACALLFPAALWLGHPGAMWAACLCLSVFFPTSMPRGLLRGAAAVGFMVVLAAGGILLLIPTPLGAHARAVWGAILVTLSIQSVIATGRLRGQRMRVVVSDPLP